MKKITNTDQLTRGQRVVVIEKFKGFSAEYYTFISEDVTTNDKKLKGHYGYFADMADRPKRFYLCEKRGTPLYADFTREDILKMAKEYHEAELAEIEKELNGETQNWQNDEE